MKKILIILLLLLPVHCLAFITELSQEGLMLAVIQDQYRFDFDNIKSASLVNNDDNTFKGLLVELKPAAVASLAKITSDGFNKEIMIIFNNKVVSSTIIKTPLGAKVLFSGISLADAQTFLIMLHNKKEEKDKKENADNNKLLFAN